ncbi:hypothetical protein QJS10_CPA05g02373 [Acorus calamus]|uniref:Uncharacterized protein n=1 Tax=Acorus calamus TaxID=4465 RepID=A0AAV9EUI8_ACOCL|nr:hypothetical protein QJS10_CPA05g02373 [Acorus calamus]
MGTTLQQYSSNLLAKFPKNDTDAIDIGQETGHYLGYSENKLLKEKVRTGFNQLQESMDRLLEQCNRETVRNTMLKHEEVFREQVHELHRLYRVQKSLMVELKNRETKPHKEHGFYSSTSTSITKNRYPHQGLNPYYDAKPGSSSQEQPSVSSREAFHVLQRGSDVDDGESDVELTLSIGRGGSKSDKDSVPDPSKDFNSGSSQRPPPPPWLFQALKF